MGRPDPGVQSSNHNGTTTTVTMTLEGDEQSVLAAALSTGPVTHFAVSKPNLTELFREVVGA